jgi:Tol biopolymer transport system component
MTLRNLLLVTALAAFLFASPGCSQYYNGGYGLKSSDREAVLAYEKARQERAEKMQQVELETKRTGPVAFESGGLTTESGPIPRPGYNMNAGGAGSANVQNVASRSTGALSLYGQVPNALRARTSPLDGINNLRQVTFTTEGADFDPDIDPTGTFIVHASTRHRETSDLYIKSVTGSALRQLTDDPANEVMPTFSPDGSRIAFASDRAGNWDIYIVDVKGGQAVQVTSDPTDDIHPSFSRDGQQLIYSSYGSQSGQWEMVIVDLNNPATKRYVGHGLFPSWSPTQDKIVFQRARQRGTRWFSIWTIDLVNGEPMSPTEIAASTNAAAITPDWSPDGKQIVFCTVIDPDAQEKTGPPQADIWLINAEGTNRVRLTMGQFANIQPVWAPSGAIFFTSDRSGEGMENVWSIQPERAQRLASQPVEPMMAQGDPNDRANNPGEQSQGTEAMVPTE